MPKWTAGAVAIVLILAWFAVTPAVAATNVSGAITSDTTWSAADGPFLVTGPVTVDSGVTLSIAAGTVVKFESRILLRVNGTLTVSGTAADPVYFTEVRDDSVGGDSNGDGAATSPAAGGWGGIAVNDGGSADLAGCRVRYAGGYVYYWPERSAIYKTGAGTLTLQDSTVTDSAGYGVHLKDASGAHVISAATIESNVTHGLWLENAGTAMTISGNTFTGNGSYGLYASGGSLATVTGNSFSGNGTAPVGMTAANAGLLVAGDNDLGGGVLYVEGGTVTGDASWQSPWPYLVSGGVTVDAGVTLSIAAGTVVKFESRILLRVNGTLTVSGTAADPVYFTEVRDDSVGGDSNGDGAATSPAAGGWGGLAVNDGGSASLAGCRVRYAGGYVSYWSERSALYKTGAGTLTVQDSTVTGSAGYGVHLKDASGAHVISAATIENNSSHGLWLENAGTAMTISGNTFTGNGSYGLYASGGSLATVTGNSFSGNGTGPVGMRAPNSGLLVAGDNDLGGGMLYVEGGTVTGDASWQSPWPYLISGGVTVDAGVTLNIAAGTVVKFASRTLLSVNGTLTASGTAAAPIYLTEIRDDSVGGDSNGDGAATSPAAGGWGGIAVNDGGSASLVGCRVRYAGGYVSYWSERSALYKTGAGTLTVQDSMVSDSAGYGVHLKNASGAHVISAATIDGSGNHGVLMETSQNVTVENSTIQASGADGIHLQDAGAVLSHNLITGNQVGGVGATGVGSTQLIGNTLTNNDIGVRCFSGATPVIGGNLQDANSIFGNSTYGVLNSTTTVTVDARYNWWGSGSGPYHPATNPDGQGDAVSDYVDYGTFLSVENPSPTADIAIDPAQLDFGRTMLATESGRTVMIANNGGTDLVLGTATLSGADAATFTLDAAADNCSGQTLTPFTACSLKVLFAPNSEGARTAALEVPSNDTEAPVATVPLAGSGVPCVGPPAGLIHWWPADGDAVELVAGADGLLVNDAGFAAGEVGQAFAFDGIAARVEVVESTVGDFGAEPFSVEFWMQTQAATANSYLLGKSNPDAGQGWDIRLDGDALQVTGVDGWGSDITTGSVIVPNTWHHVALVSDGVAVQLYVDGASDPAWSSARAAISAATNGFRLGDQDNFSGAAFTGLLDEVRIYNRALTAAEVADVFAVAEIGVCRPEAVPTGAAPFIFADQRVAPDTLIVSEAVTLSGMAAPQPIQLAACNGSDCAYRVDGGTWSSAASLVADGSMVEVRLRSPATPGSSDLSLDVGGTRGAFQVTVNAPPTIDSVAPTSAIQDTAYGYTLAASDPNGDPLTYSAPVLPSWLAFDPATRQLTGTPAAEDVGDHAVTLRVGDGTVTVDQAFTITVSADSDGDGLADAGDPCPLDPDNDRDADGICGDVDNCPGRVNADQYDSNGDGTGDVCEVLDPAAMAGDYHLVNLHGEFAGEDFNALFMNGTAWMNLADDGSWEHDYIALAYGQPAATAYGPAGPYSGAWSAFRDGHLELEGRTAIRNGARSLFVWTPVPREIEARRIVAEGLAPRIAPTTGLGIALQPATGLGDADLNDEYHLVSVAARHEGADTGAAVSTALGAITFDGARGYSGAYSSAAQGQASDGPLTVGAFSGGYQLDTDGRLQLDTVATGYLASDRDFLVWTHAPGNAADEPTGLHVALKPASAADLGTLRGRYNLVGYRALQAGADTGALYSSGFGHLTFDGAGTFSGAIEGTADGQPFYAAMVTGPVSGTYSVGSDGTLQLEGTFPDGGATWQMNGYVGPDGRMAVYAPVPGPVDSPAYAGKATGLTLLLAADPEDLFPPATGAALQADPGSPQLAGTAVTFTGSVEGNGSYEYRFFVKGPEDAKATQMQAYSTDNTFDWTTPATTGTYSIGVQVRTLGSTAAVEAQKWIGYTVVSAATGATISADPASPRLAGVPVTFTGQGSGGSGSYEYRFFVKAPGDATATQVQAYSTANTFAWTTPATTGTYSVGVQVRTLGSTAPVEAQKWMGYTVVSAATGATISADPASPQLSGVPVTFTGQGSGGSGSYEYRFFVKAPGDATATMMQGYSTANTFDWTTPATTGTYSIGVQVRTVGSTAPVEAQKWIGYTVVSAATGATISADPASPRLAGVPVTFTGQGSGGSGSYEYRFFVKGPEDATATLMQPYSTDNTFAWTTPATTGTYSVGVQVRTLGSTAPVEAQKWMGYTVVSAATGATISADPASPRLSGVPVTFTGQGSGATGSYEYRFFVKAPGDATATMMQGYSTDNTFAWTTPATTGTYSVGVQVRALGSTAPVEAQKWVSYTVQ